MTSQPQPARDTQPVDAHPPQPQAPTTNGPTPVGQVPTLDAGEQWNSPYHYSNPRQTVSSWVISTSIHVLLFAALLFALYQVPKGFGEEKVITGSIVLVADSLDKNEKVYLDQDDVESPEKSADAAAASAAAVAAAVQSQQLTDDLPDLPGMISEENASTQATAQHQSNTGVGEMAVPTNQNGGGNVGQKEVRFGGVSGTGSRFVYVVDCSASMNGENAKLMKAAKAELEISLRSLTEQQQFQVLFYNDDWQAFQRDPGPMKMYEGTESNVDAALKFSERVRPTGGTQHTGPILQALALGADVIFLLTDADGGLREYELREIERANRTGAVISVIVYGQTQSPTAANATFQRLTRPRGTFAFKSVSSLGN